MVYNIGAGILRAVGDSHTPFLILAISGLMNVLLDLLFVAVFRWSAPGAAFATVLSQIASSCMVLLVLARANGSYRWRIRKERFSGKFLKDVLVIGLPIALQSVLYPISNMTVQSAVNQTGTDNIVAWALCGKLDFLIWLVADSLAAAISTFAAQNYGARHMKRVKTGVSLGLAITVGLVLLISAVLFLWSEPLGGLILSRTDGDIAGVTGRLMRVMAPFYFLYVLGAVYAGAIQGMGESLRPMVLTLLCSCGLRILWILLFPHNHALIKILLIYPISWGANGLTFAIYYRMFLRGLFRR